MIWLSIQYVNKTILWQPSREKSGFQEGYRNLDHTHCAKYKLKISLSDIHCQSFEKKIAKHILTFPNLGTSTKSWVLLLLYPNVWQERPRSFWFRVWQKQWFSFYFFFFVLSFRKGRQGGWCWLQNKHYPILAPCTVSERVLLNCSRTQ